MEFCLDGSVATLLFFISVERFHTQCFQIHTFSKKKTRMPGRQVSYFFLLFPTFWGLSYFFLLLGKIPTFSYFFRFLLKLIDKNAIFKPKKFLGLTSLGIISFSK